MADSSLNPRALRIKVEAATADQVSDSPPQLPERAVTDQNSSPVVEDIQQRPGLQTSETVQAGEDSSPVPRVSRRH